MVQNPDAFVGKRVRWGGTIVTVENRRTETWLEIVARPLQRGGRPTSTGATTGRFFGRVAGFLEPETYQRGREVTVVGTLSQSITRTIGEFPYPFPVVNVETAYLWEQLPDYDPYYYRRYYWDAPYYYPWWPYGPFHHYPYLPYGYRYH